jgi:hypothetical protein
MKKYIALILCIYATLMLCAFFFSDSFGKQGSLRFLVTWFMCHVCLAFLVASVLIQAYCAEQHQTMKDWTRLVLHLGCIVAYIIAMCALNHIVSDLDTLL